MHVIYQIIYIFKSNFFSYKNISLEIERRDRFILPAKIDGVFMKKFVLIIAALGVSATALATGKFDNVDLRQTFANTQINLINDGAGGSGVDILLRGVPGKDFVVFTKTKGSVSQCKVLAVKQVSASPATSVVRIAASTEFDDGSSCYGIIHYNSGHTAVVTMFSTGT
jgi:hypothetical protein